MHVGRFADAEQTQGETYGQKDRRAGSSHSAPSIRTRTASKSWSPAESGTRSSVNGCGIWLFSQGGNGRDNFTYRQRWHLFRVRRKAHQCRFASRRSVGSATAGNGGPGARAALLSFFLTYPASVREIISVRLCRRVRKLPASILCLFSNRPMARRSVPARRAASRSMRQRSFAASTRSGKAMF